MAHSSVGSSGANGAQKPERRFTPISIESLPAEPTVPQKVKFFTARDTFIAETALPDIPAIDFDAVMLRLFGDVEDIDRQVWEMADRLFALNIALSQAAERRENGQPSIRLDAVPGGFLQLTLIEPVEPDDAGESAIQSTTNEGGPPDATA